MRRRDLSELILDQVQVFDQQVTLPRAVPKQCLDLRRGMGVDGAPFRHRARPRLAPAGVLEFPDFPEVFGGFAIAHNSKPSILHTSRQATLPEGCLLNQRFG